MGNNADEILKKHEEENRRSAMAKRVAEEEIRKNDFTVKNWHGDPRSIYQFSMGSWKWKNMGLGKRTFVVSVSVLISIIFILFILAQSGVITL